MTHGNMKLYHEMLAYALQNKAKRVVMAATFAHADDRLWKRSTALRISAPHTS